VDDISWRLSTSRPLGVECEEKSLVRVGVTLNDMKGRDERWRGKSSERAEHVKGRYWAIAKMFMISAMIVVCDLMEFNVVEYKLLVSNSCGQIDSIKET